MQRKRTRSANKASSGTSAGKASKKQVSKGKKEDDEEDDGADVEVQDMNKKRRGGGEANGDSDVRRSTRLNRGSEPVQHVEIANPPRTRKRAATQRSEGSNRSEKAVSVRDSDSESESENDDDEDEQDEDEDDDNSENENNEKTTETEMKSSSQISRPATPTLPVITTPQTLRAAAEGRPHSPNILSPEFIRKSESEQDGNAMLVPCPHLGCIEYEKIKELLFDVTTWSCQKCGTTESVWACLVCGYTGCGRFQNGDAKAHFKETQHPIVLEINEQLCHCYLCDSYVINDNESGDIDKVRVLLGELKQHTFVTSKRTDVEENESSVAANREKHLLEDKLSTVIQKCRMMLLMRAFNSWKYVWQKNTGLLPEDEPNVDIDKKLSESPSAPSTPTRGGNLRRSLILRQNTLFTPGQTGLRNLGNTCFLNSILQSLSYTKELRDFVIQFIPAERAVMISNQRLWRRDTITCFNILKERQANRSTSEISLTAELHYVLRVLWSGKWAVITPSSLLEAVWRFIPRFHNHQQQDAQELLCCFLDRLDDELKSSSATIEDDHHKNVAGSLDSESVSIIKKKDTIISDLFQGQLLSSMQEMQNVSTTPDPFLDLCLDIPIMHVHSRRKDTTPKCTVNDCFNAFMKEEIIDCYTCSKCGPNQTATKRLQINKLPRVLCIVLKRFCWTASNRAKNDATVTFPPRGLDIKAYTSANISKDTPTTYNLRSVVIHHGTGLRAGHYTSICYNTERKLWVHFNDSKVATIPEKEVLELQTPYILFYELAEPEFDP